MAVTIGATATLPLHWFGLGLAASCLITTGLAPPLVRARLLPIVLGALAVAVILAAPVIAQMLR